jgi:hypothetical protein
MKVFLSWSGLRGRRVAEGFRAWLPDVLHKVEPWLSTEDIDPGVRWNANLAAQLEESRFGVIYYRGSPTVFGIATSEAMLLNPYPYENESHRCWTVVARKTDDPEDIYHQYFDAHFERPWTHAVPVEEAGGPRPQN